MKPANDTITWATYNNVAGVVVSAIMIAVAFYGVSTRVAVLETKMDTLIAQNTRVLNNLNELNSRIVTLETLHREDLR